MSITSRASWRFPQARVQQRYNRSQSVFVLLAAYPREEADIHIVCDLVKSRFRVRTPAQNQRNLQNRHFGPSCVLIDLPKDVTAGVLQTPLLRKATTPGVNLALPTHGPLAMLELPVDSSLIKQAVALIN